MLKKRTKHKKPHLKDIERLELIVDFLKSGKSLTQYGKASPHVSYPTLQKMMVAENIYKLLDKLSLSKRIDKDKLATIRAWLKKPTGKNKDNIKQNIKTSIEKPEQDRIDNLNEDIKLLCEGADANMKGLMLGNNLLIQKLIEHKNALKSKKKEDRKNILNTKELIGITKQLQRSFHTLGMFNPNISAVLQGAEMPEGDTEINQSINILNIQEHNEKMLQTDPFFKSVLPIEKNSNIIEMQEIKEFEPIKDEERIDFKNRNDVDSNEYEIEESENLKKEDLEQPKKDRKQEVALKVLAGK